MIGAASAFMMAVSAAAFVAFFMMVMAAAAASVFAMTMSVTASAAGVHDNQLAMRQVDDQVFSQFFGRFRDDDLDAVHIFGFIVFIKRGQTEDRGVNPQQLSCISTISPSALVCAMISSSAFFPSSVIFIINASGIRDPVFIISHCRIQKYQDDVSKRSALNRQAEMRQNIYVILI